MPLGNNGRYFPLYKYPNQGWMVAIHETLKNSNYGKRASIKSLLELLKLVLYKNNFDFNGKHYLQIGGTAMGTKLAPSYANLFMGQLEKKLLQGYHIKPRTFLRFIDDIFLIVPGT